MPALAVRIVRFVDETQPGVVECEFVDASGHRHTLRDKVPIFSRDSLDASSEYPQLGVADCELLARWEDERGQELSRITTVRPFDIESLEGLSEFVVFSSQLVTAPATPCDP